MKKIIALVLLIYTFVLSALSFSSCQFFGAIGNGNGVNNSGGINGSSGGGNSDGDYAHVDEKTMKYAMIALRLLLS